MRTRSSTRSLALAGALVLVGWGAGCSTESPTAPTQTPGAPIQLPPPPKPEDAEVSFTCEVAPPGFDAPGQLTIAFTNESTVHYVQFLWQFGDGATSRQEDPTHTYRLGATTGFQATLTATAAFGSDSFRLFVPNSCEGFEEDEEEEL